MTVVPTSDPRRLQQDDAEHALDQLRKLQAVTDAALANLKVEDLLDELLVRVQEVMGVDTAAILLLDDEADVLVAQAAKGIEEEVRQGVRIPVGRGFAGRIAAERRPVVIGRVDHGNVMNPILREKKIVSLAGVPLITQGRIIGVLHVGSLTPRTFTPADVQLLQLVGDRVALAIFVGLYERERVIAETLQRSLLPESLPFVFGLDFAARYVPAGGEGIGGDWYDAFVLPNGNVAIAVGDVVGRGLRAAAVMGRLRNALRAFAFEGHSPEETLELMNAMIRFLDQDEMATLIYGVLDPRKRRLTIANAGHLPPVVSHPRQRAALVDVSTHPPLGASFSSRADALTVDLVPGSTVLLYTDGIVERRSVPLDERLTMLCDVVDWDGPLDGLVDSVLAKLGGDQTSDDMALLAVRLSQDVTGGYSMTVDADPARLAELRSTLRGWLADAGVPSDLVFDILVATGEACANAIEHAYGPGGGQIEMTLAKSEEYLEATIRDHGAWREPRGRHRGRGLSMMRRLAASVDVVSGADGTQIRLGWKLRSPQ